MNPKALQGRWNYKTHKKHTKSTNMVYKVRVNKAVIISYTPHTFLPGSPNHAVRKPSMPSSHFISISQNHAYVSRPTVNVTSLLILSKNLSSFY